jgi:mRNA-degrading endonuclease toxin of MazEF toxin-antitoxin module
MVTVVPITTKERKLCSYLCLAPPDGGLPQTSYVICDQVRTIAKSDSGDATASYRAPHSRRSRRG